MDPEQADDRFNTIDPSGTDEPLLTHGSSVSNKNKQQNLPLDTARAGLTMQGLMKEYQTRTDFFKDFYQNVQSYSNFDADKAYDDFLQRKAEAD